MSLLEQQITIDAPATRRLAEAYSVAWNAHDLDAIMALHGPLTAFHLHVEPYPEAEGHDAVRQQFTAIFTMMPDISFETVRLEVRPGLFTQEWYATATLTQPFPIGDRLAEPTGRPVRFRGVDVISCEDGRVRRKDCYLDGIGLVQQLFPAP